MVVKALFVLGFLLAALLLNSLEVTARESAKNIKEEQTNVVEDAKYGTNEYTIHVGEVSNNVAVKTLKKAGVSRDDKYHPNCMCCVMEGSSCYYYCCDKQIEDPNNAKPTVAIPQN